MIPNTPFDGLAAARDAAADLSAQAAEGEALGRLPEPSIAALRQAGLLRLWRPQSLGGHEVSPLDYAHIAESVAQADSAAAWLMMAVANTTFDLRYADERLVEEVFESHPDPIVCESFNRPFSGAAVTGGYRVSGTVPFVSGCHHAGWIGHTAVIDDRFLLMFHPAAALEILDDWDTLGMRATSSNSVRAVDVFVPGHRIIDFSAPPARNRYFQGDLYRMPEGILTTTFPPVSLGIVTKALDAVQTLARHKTPFAASATLKHRALAQSNFGRALASHRASRALFHHTIDQAYRHAVDGRPFSLTDKADLFLACALALQSSAETARLLARIAGTSAIHRGSVLERALRDTEVIAHHAFGAEGRFASVAQAYWGVEVDFPLLGMD